jgi:shikimate kinase
MAPVAVLIGAPGAGKSTVGRRVATRLSVPFADSDREIEERAGMSVADIFVTQGEASFRDLEAATVADLLGSSAGILSLGGGAVLRAETRAALSGHRVVWLRVGVPAAASRVGMNTARPLLLGNVRGTLTALLAERDPVYAEVATDTVDTDGRPVGAVVDAVVEVLA